MAVNSHPIIVLILSLQCLPFLKTQTPQYHQLMLGDSPPYRIINGVKIPVEELSMEGLQNMYLDEMKFVIREPITIAQHFKNESAHQHDDKLFVTKMAEKIKVLCWVMTFPENHRTKAIHVKKTWGRRCNKLLFMSTEDDPLLPAVKLPVSEGPEFLWAKTKAAFRYIFTHHRDEADWFLKAEDDTYVIVEHLRFLLLQYKTNYPIYVGPRWMQYPSSGAGYVLSREALRRLANSMQQPACVKPAKGDSEDVSLHDCLHDLGIRSEKSMDSSGRERFSLGRPSDDVFQFLPQWHRKENTPYDPYDWKFAKHGRPEDITPYGMDNHQEEASRDIFSSYSPTAVSFHYISPTGMYVLEYMLYHLQAYGTKNDYYKKSIKSPRSMRVPKIPPKTTAGYRNTPVTVRSVSI